MSGTTLLKPLNSSKRDWRSPIRKMACCLSFLLWLALLQTSLAVNVPGPNGTVVTQILSATSSNPEVKVVEDRDLGKILVYPPQPKEFTVKIIARIMYPDDQYLEKISTVMVGGAGVTIESDEIRNSLILATLKVAPGASGGRFSITYENEDNPNHKGCNVRLLPVDLTVDKAKLTLLEGNTLKVEGADKLPNGLLDGVKFEIKRDGEATWYEIQDGAAIEFKGKARVAGKFKVRATLDLDSKEIQTEEEPIEVQFPEYSKIVADSNVISKTDAAWASTKAAANAVNRIEQGFWVSLDTKQEKYITTALVSSPPADNASGVGINLGARPADSIADPTPLDQPTYTVASFHTHTPTFYRPFGRGVGPSGPDHRIDRADDITGIVYDYTGDSAGNIPSGHPLHSPAKRYQSGNSRRLNP